MRKISLIAEISGYGLNPFLAVMHLPTAVSKIILKAEGVHVKLAFEEWNYHVYLGPLYIQFSSPTKCIPS